MPLSDPESYKRHIWIPPITPPSATFLHIFTSHTQSDFVFDRKVPSPSVFFRDFAFRLKKLFMDQILKDVDVGNEEKRIDKFLLFTCFFIESEKLWGGWVWWGQAEGWKREVTKRLETKTIFMKIPKKETKVLRGNKLWMVLCRCERKESKRAAPVNFSDAKFMLPHFNPSSRFRSFFTRPIKQSFSINIILFLLTINAHMLQHTCEIRKIGRRHQKFPSTIHALGRFTSRRQLRQDVSDKVTLR